MTQETNEEVSTVAMNAPIESVQAFGDLVVGWHENMLARLRYMLTVPTGTVIEVNNVDVILQDDAHKGFEAALIIAISELEKLPFSTSNDQAH